jgi:hypothetical protein
MKKMTEKELEQFIHRQLRDLPPRRAPRSLESRVLAAIEDRAAIAWYHKSWSYWPAAIRAAFMAIGSAACASAIAAFYLLSQGVDVRNLAGEFASRFEVLATIYNVGSWLFGFVAATLNSIPSLWLYGGLAFVAVMYATFFGLGAAAYRTLYRSN